MATKCIDHMPPPKMSAAAASQMRCVGSLGRRHASAEIQGGVRCEGSDQNGQGNEILIICSGNDHRIPPYFGLSYQRVKQSAANVYPLRI